MNPHLIGIICGILGMIGFGLGNAYAKKVSQEIGTKSTLFFREIIIFISFSLIYFLIPQPSFVMDTKILILTFAVGICAYIALWSYYHAITIGNIGVVSAISNSEIIIAILLTVIFLGEVLYLHHILGILLILAGVIRLSLNKEGKVKGPEIPFAIFTMVVWGFTYFLYVYPIRTFGPILTSFLIDATLFLCVIVYMIVQRKKIIIPQKTRWQTLGMGLMPVMGLIAYTYGFAFASSVSLVIAMVGANPLVMALYAHFIYGEKLAVKQWCAIFAVVIGIAVISF